MSGQERREFPRSKSSVPVSKSDDGVLDHVDNISGNGVLCHTNKPVALMTKMSIAIELPGDDSGERVQCEGVVVRCDPDDKTDGKYEVAILYTHVEEDDRERIEAFVERDIADSFAEDDEDDD